jgi:hypothetical protein
MKKREKPRKSNIFSSKRIFIYLMGAFIILIMVASVININKNSVEKYKYKGNKFTKTDQGWLTYKDDKAVLLSYGPKELEGFNVNVDINNLFLLQKIYISFNPLENLQLAITDFLTNLNFNYLVRACTVNIEPCIDLPLKGCDDADLATGVIIFKESKTAKVSLDRNCLIIEGEGEDLVKITDRLILDHYGLM